MAVLKYRDPVTGERVRIPTTENVAVTGTASGDLTGEYPAPHIAPGVITDVEVASANKDGAAGVPSMRTIGAGSTQVVAGNDSRLTNSRAPSGAATGDLVGNYPSPTPVAIKPPCRVVTTANVTLSGLQTIDGVTLVANDRVLVSAQTTTNQNGIYLAQSGAWTRSADANFSGSLVLGSQVFVNAGTANAGTLWMVSAVGAVPWVPGTNTTLWDTYRGPIRSVISISGATTALAAARTEYFYLCTAALTLTLPTAVGNTCHYTIKNKIAGTITIATTSSQTIDGAAPAPLTTQWATARYISDGANWVSV